MYEEGLFVSLTVSHHCLHGKVVLHFYCELLLIIKIEYFSKIIVYILSVVILPKILLLLVASVTSFLSLIDILGYIIKIDSLKKFRGHFIFFYHLIAFDNLVAAPLMKENYGILQMQYKTVLEMINLFFTALEVTMLSK